MGQEMPAEQVRLELRGGDRLSGHVLAEDDEVITLLTSFGAEVAVPHEEIIAAEWLDQAPSEPAHADPAQASRQGEPEEPIEVTGEMELGAALVASARDRRDYLSRLDLTFRRGGDHLRLRGLVDIQEANDVKLRDRQSAAISFQKELTAPWFTTLSGRWLRDPTTGLSHRTTAFAQVGQTIFDDDLHRLTAKAGPGFAEEHRKDGTDWITPLLAWGLEYEFYFSGFWERFSLSHEQEGSVDPRGSPLRLLLESDTALRYRITDDLYVALSGTVDLDSLSPDTARTLDRRLQLRLGYAW